MKGAAESEATITALPSWISDRTLVQFVAERDKAALKLLYLRHGSRVYRFVARLTCSQLAAEEAVNDTFLEVWRDARQFNRESQVATWLLGIARIKALSRWRSYPKVQPDLDAQHFIDDASGGAAACMKYAEGPAPRRNA